MNQQPLISVIVPTFKEGREVFENLSPLRDDPQIEVIVVEGKKIGVANRARQMNLGARQAHGDLLVFLHADTQVKREDLIQLADLINQKTELIGGAFRFCLDKDHWRARLIEFGVRLRERLFRLPYGDQAIFVRRSIFGEIGGYPEVPLLEDVLLIQKMKLSGKLISLPQEAITSARRWEQHGYLKTTLVNWATMILWRVGVSLEAIVNFRRRVFHDAVHGDIEKQSARNQTEAA